MPPPTGDTCAFEQWRLKGGTSAFEEWRSTYDEIRGYFHLTTTWIDARYQQRFDEISQLPGHPDCDAPIDILFRETGVDIIDYFWMLRAAVIRDAVTAFELYLADALTEAQQRRGENPIFKAGKQPRWPELCRAYKAVFGLEIETGQVKQLRDLRHLLTHQRGQLRTKAQREQYATSDDGGFPYYRVEPDDGAVVAMLADMDQAARTAETQICGGHRQPLGS